MRTVVPRLAVLASVMLSLTGCGGGGGEEVNTKVFKSMGVQCSASVPLATLQAQLTTANVQVHAAACGKTEGVAYAAVCGGPDGSIGIFDISPSQAGAAVNAGFTPLNTLPGAKTIPCP